MQKQTNMKQTIKIDIFRCARCEQVHIQLEFKKLQKPFIDSDGMGFEVWALCPLSREPILLSSKTIEETKA